MKTNPADMTRVELREALALRDKALGIATAGLRDVTAEGGPTAVMVARRALDEINHLLAGKPGHQEDPHV